MTDSPVSMGLDFGTETVRVVLIDATGKELGVGTHDYKHGQITSTLPGGSERLPEHYALQAPGDWIESASIATREAVKDASIDPTRVIGIGVDFTSCTMLPTRRDGTPLCHDASLASTPLSWPKLWKHHGAISQTDRMNQIATDRGERFLSTIRWDDRSGVVLSKNVGNDRSGSGNRRGGRSLARGR